MEAKELRCRSLGFLRLRSSGSSAEVVASFIRIIPLCTYYISIRCKLNLAIRQKGPSTLTMKWSHFLLALPALAHAQTKCSFLPEAEAPTIELALPASALIHPLQDLPIEFRGYSPIVTRKTLKAGEKPKITVLKYSAKPTIVYDDISGKVVVSASGCGGDGAYSGAFSRSCSSWFPMAGATFLAGIASGPTAAVSVAAAGFLHGAHAQGESCEPVVQLVVEAPSAYVGAYETCLNEIGDPAVCPGPFPTYATCDDPAPTCGLVVVGAGAGGLYTALRYVTFYIHGKILFLKSPGPGFTCSHFYLRYLFPTVWLTKARSMLQISASLI